MVYKLFRGVTVAKLFGALFLSLVIYIPLFLRQLPPQQLSFWLLTDLFAYLQGIFPLAIPLLIFALVILQSFLIINLGQTYLLLETRTYMPLFIFMGLSVFYSASQYALATAVVGPLFLWCITLIFENPGYKVKLSSMFNIGLIFAISALFFWQIVFLIPVIWMMTFFVGVFTMRSLLSLIAGFIPPLLLLAYGLIFFGKWNLFLHTLKPLVNENVGLNDIPFYNQIAIMMVAIPVLGGLLREIFVVQNKKIIVRKYFQSLNFLFLISLPLALLVAFIPLSFTYLALLALPLATSNFLLRPRYKRFNNMLFLFFIAGIVLFWLARYNLLF